MDSTSCAYLLFIGLSFFELRGVTSLAAAMQSYDCSARLIESLMTDRDFWEFQEVLGFDPRGEWGSKAIKSNEPLLVNVLGEGNSSAELMFIADDQAPSEVSYYLNESGALLAKMIQAMGFQRDDVYLSLQNSFESLKTQIENIKPKIIVTLGEGPTQILSQSQRSFEEIKGKFFELDWTTNKNGDSIQVLSTYAPSFLLKHAECKRETWAHLQMVMSNLKSV